LPEPSVAEQADEFMSHGGPINRTVEYVSVSSINLGGNCKTAMHLLRRKTCGK
jgi:hypothetical protein